MRPFWLAITLFFWLLTTVLGKDKNETFPSLLSGILEEERQIKTCREADNRSVTTWLLDYGNFTEYCIPCVSGNGIFLLRGAPVAFSCEKRDSFPGKSSSKYLALMYFCSPSDCYGHFTPMFIRQQDVLCVDERVESSLPLQALRKQFSECVDGKTWLRAEVARRTTSVHSEMKEEARMPTSQKSTLGVAEDNVDPVDKMTSAGIAGIILHFFCLLCTFMVQVINALNN